MPDIKFGAITILPGDHSRGAGEHSAISLSATRTLREQLMRYAHAT
ncbi:MAG: hypothetical protein F6K26_45540 [Moorea sp. SIO2I5]|nr:hypothetical protein [Moorena sp. SIO2I5]